MTSQAVQCGHNDSLQSHIWYSGLGGAQRRYDMRHEMLSQRAPFCIGTMAKKGTLSQHFVTLVVPPLESANAR